jgi:hypothetical protein
MTGPFFRVQLRLLSADQGGRPSSVFSDYRPSWDLGNTWLGKPTINDGRVLLEGCTELAPGGECVALVQPLVAELWGGVRPGAVIAMHEGTRVVGYARVLEIASCPDYWTPEVAVFVAQAMQFCDFVENAAGSSLRTRLFGARQRLLELYAAASVLPQVEPQDDKVARPSPAATHGRIEFDAFETYWEVFDPYVDAERVAGSLSDDLRDVYRDLQRGLELWQDVAARPSAIWEWRFHFDVHWGDHAIDALRALHRACGRVTEEPA